MARRSGLLILISLFVFVSVAANARPPDRSSSLQAAYAAGGQPSEQSVDDFKPTTERPGPQDTGRFVVLFEQRADLGPAPDIDDRRQRGEFVIDELRQVADAAQAEAIRVVEQTPGARAESHWLRNALVVEGDETLQERLRQLPGVAEVRPERVFELIEPVERLPFTQEEDLPWGLSAVGADQAWKQGVLGGGVVVASIDSGVQFDHPALVDSYRGNLGDGSFDHNYNWFDAAEGCSDPEPCDEFGHGTHTMGTMVGGDGPGPFTPDTGVAPAAEWITVSCGTFFCSEGQLIAAGEWILAPTDLAGENPDPARRPDVVNNSWGGEPGDPFFLDMVAAWRAAGIAPVFASGNPGPFCGAGGSPGDYNEAFSAGATDEAGLIAEFSGRGPSPFGKINPDVAAPGVGVLSSVPGDGYELFSGTSMAAPHVVGTMALMLSADPDSRGQVGAIEDVVRSTAVDVVDETCGGAENGDPNNVYGDGRVDAAAAVAVVATGGTMTGTITDAGSGSGIGGARVSATSADWESSAFTDESGTYTLLVPAGTYTVTADAFGYEAAVVPGVVIEQDTTTSQDLALDLLPIFTVRGRVVSAESNQPIVGATIEVVGTPVPTAVSGERGSFSLDVPLGSYTLEARRGGCTLTHSVEVDVFSDVRVTLPVATKIDDFGHGCQPIDFDWVDAETQSALYGDDVGGRLNLPFEFPFYGETYSQVFMSTNGFLHFVDEFLGFSPPFNTAVPDVNPPNAAIYALWQDLVVDEESEVHYDAVEVDGQSVFVIEYHNVRPFGGTSRADFEVKLWDDGTVDLLYGSTIDELGNGSSATVGIENAEGTDALQFSFFESLVEPNRAWRFDKVPTGTLVGTVVNANDGLPVASATVEVEPGGRTARTGEDGTYQLTLVPGRYTVSATADDYTPAEASARIGADRQSTADFSLAAAAAELSVTEISATVEVDATDETTVVVSNVGTAPMVWEFRERELSAPPVEEPLPELVVDDQPFLRDAEWARPTIPEALRSLVVARPTFEGPLDPIIEDGAGDADGAVDVLTVSAGTDGVEASFAIDFAEDSPTGELGGFLFFDTDQDQATGLPPEALSGLATQDIGLDFFADLFGASFGEVLIVDANTFEVVAIVEAVLEGQTLRFDFPLEAVGGDDGAMDVAGVLGDFAQPTDWVPDEGHGTLDLFRDTEWMDAAPSSGTIDPGDSREIVVTLGGAGVEAGSYEGLLALLTNDPRTPRVEITIELTVGN